ncbi:transcriptional repressor [Vibrio sp. CAIM 722]|uniref:Transcriptional repressor n=1 Tax=Vibrio eleionomae TaxID=2653505 RepID=A0A7X4RT47_9VIBR|nr:transcriptional repressor [Vibrio eleionomae]MZI91837.1 transcriptional repressor [Vibrio eleionomae]
MTKIERILNYAKDSCLTHGSHLTPKRKVILMGLIESGKALSAYELVDYCKENYSEVIPVMSVYRILEFFQQLHLVHRLHIVNKYVSCSHILDDDDNECSLFLICTKCNKVKEVHVDESMLRNLKNSINDSEFHVVTPQLELECECDECAEKDTQTRSSQKMNQDKR